MLQKFFLWFYCLSISDAVILVIVVTAVFLLLRRNYDEKRFWKPTMAVLFLAWLVVIAVATLADRTPAELPSTPQLIPFHSYRSVFAGATKEILRSNFMNVILFYPVGLLACELLPKGWSRRRKIVLCVCVFALMSIGIECAQYILSLGQTEIDDVIHNTLGAFIGTWISTLRIGGERTENGHQI